MNTTERLLVENRTAEVLGRNAADGTPLFWRHRVGAGEIGVLAVPLELSVATTPGAFDITAAANWKVYAPLLPARTARVLPPVGNPNVAVTEHPVSDVQTAVVAINHTAAEQTLCWADVRAIQSVAAVRGKVGLVDGSIAATIPPFDAVVMTLGRRPLSGNDP